MDKSSYQIRINQWKFIIHDQAASNLNKSEWCRENDINLRQFFYWQRKLRNMFLKSSDQLPALPSSEISKTALCELSVPNENPVSFIECPEPDLIIEIND